jgi:hypothetical protein
MKPRRGLHAQLLSLGWEVNATPGERPGTHCTGGWVGPRAGLEGSGKSDPPPLGFDSRTVQPVAGRYTDCASQNRKLQKTTSEVSRKILYA